MSFSLAQRKGPKETLPGTAADPGCDRFFGVGRNSLEKYHRRLFVGDPLFSSMMCCNSYSALKQPAHCCRKNLAATGAALQRAAPNSHVLGFNVMINRKISTCYSFRRRQIIHYAITLLLIASFVAPFPAHSTEVKHSALTPIEVVAAYFEAYRNMEWARAAQYVHPKSLAEFKKKIIAIIIRTEQSGQQELVEEFGVDSLALLEFMPPADFYGAVNRRFWAKLDGKQAEYLRSCKITILNTKVTAEGTTVVSFRTRVVFEGKSSVKACKYVVLKHGDSWKIDLNNPIAAQGNIERIPPNPGLQLDAPQVPRR